MKFTKLLKYDMRSGFLSGLIRFPIISILVIAYCLDFYLSIGNAYIFDESIPAGTLIDYLFNVFAGEKEYIPSLTEPFIFPVKWLLFHLFILYSTLYYPSRDLSSLGLNILVRTKGRVAWWISKSIWNVCYVLAMYVIVYITIIIFCFVMGETFSFNITEMFVNDILDAGSPFDTFQPKLVWSILLLPIFVSIGLNLLQMTLVLFIKPLYSFGVLAIILLASTYYLSPYFPGNYAMPIRSEYVVENGVTFGGGIITSLILVVISVTIGVFYFKRYDILDKEN